MFILPDSTEGIFEKIKAEDPELVSMMSKVGQVAATAPLAAKEIEVEEEPVKPLKEVPQVKTFADNDSESKGVYTSEESATNVDTSQNTKVVASSAPDIFNYCTWEARTASTIGESSKVRPTKSM